MLTIERLKDNQTSRREPDLRNYSLERSWNEWSRGVCDTLSTRIRGPLRGNDGNSCPCWFKGEVLMGEFQVQSCSKAPIHEAAQKTMSGEITRYVGENSGAVVG